MLTVAYFLIDNPDHDADTDGMPTPTEARQSSVASKNATETTKSTMRAPPTEALDQNIKPMDPNAPKQLPTLVAPMPSTPPPMPPAVPEMPSEPPPMPSLVMPMDGSLPYDSAKTTKHPPEKNPKNPQAIDGRKR
jgi:hypothetical protein